jgi:hypothetical protein
MMATLLKARRKDVASGISLIELGVPETFKKKRKLGQYF